MVLRDSMSLRRIREFEGFMEVSKGFREVSSEFQAFRGISGEF